MIEVKVSYHVLAGEWLCQPLAGLQMLFKKKEINLKVDIHLIKKLPHSEYLEIIVSNKYILLDLHDGDTTDDKYYEQFNIIFKRSIDPQVLSKRKEASKFQPYGLNYLSTCKGNPYFSPNANNIWKFFTSKEALIRLTKNLINKYSNYLPINRKTVDLLDYSYFDYIPRKKTIDVLFLTRLWFPYDIFNTENKIKDAFKKHPELIKTYNLDLLRISVIKYLNSQHDLKSVAGISHTSNLLSEHKNLTVNGDITQRRNFISLARESKICVTTTGLWDSIGWKFGEFINLGCVVLTESNVHIVKENLVLNQNYFEFNNLDDFKNKINILLGDNDLLDKVASNNILYACKHLKPDCLMSDILNKFAIT